jgi:hypothetical protein
MARLDDRCAEAVFARRRTMAVVTVLDWIVGSIHARRAEGDERGIDRGEAECGRLVQLLHGAPAVLVLVAFLYGPGDPEARVHAASGDFDRHLHETLGPTVFILVLEALSGASSVLDHRHDPYLPPVHPEGRRPGLDAARVAARTPAPRD